MYHGAGRHVSTATAEDQLSAESAGSLNSIQSGLGRAERCTGCCCWGTGTIALKSSQADTGAAAHGRSWAHTGGLQAFSGGSRKHMGLVKVCGCAGCYCKHLATPRAPKAAARSGQCRPCSPSRPVIGWRAGCRPPIG